MIQTRGRSRSTRAGDWLLHNVDPDYRSRDAHLAIACILFTGGRRMFGGRRRFLRPCPRELRNRVRRRRTTP